MERSSFNEKKNETLTQELLRYTKDQIKDLKFLLTVDFLDMEMIHKALENITATIDALSRAIPETDEEIEQIKSLTQELIVLEDSFSKRKTFH